MIDETRWFQYTFYQQMGNIASEISRAILFQNRDDVFHMEKALWRLLELINLTVDDPKNKKRLRELCRFKEVVADWYAGTEVYNVDAESLKTYAMHFAMLAVKT